MTNDKYKMIFMISRPHNVYVFTKVFILPHSRSSISLAAKRRKVLRTQVAKETVDPIFNETFRVKIGLVEAQRKTIVFQVFDWDYITSNDEIGEVQVPLCKVNLSEGEQQWRLLHRMTGPRDQDHLPGLGKLRLQAKYEDGHFILT